MPSEPHEASICRPCRRAQRRHRTEHDCYRAVQGEDLADATTWMACECECQRTLWSLGFFEGDAQPPIELVPARDKLDAQAHDPDGSAPA